VSISKPLYSPVHNWLSAYVGEGNPLQNMNNQTTRGLVIVDNNQIKATNIRLQAKFKVGTVTPGGSIRIYMAGSLDGLVFSDNYDGAVNGDFVGDIVSDPVHSQLVATIPTPTSDTVVVWEGEILGVVPSLPRYMGFLVSNDSGGPLDGAYEHSLKASYISYEFV